MDFSQIRAVIFDFDGVIAHTAADIAASVNATLEHFGYRQLSQEQIIIFVGNGAERLLRRSIAASLQISQNAGDCKGSGEDEPNSDPEAARKDEPAFEELYDWYVDYYKSHCIEQTELYPGARDLLELLSIEGIPSAIVSNKPHEITDAILSRMNIGRYFSAVVGPEQTSHVKPDPEGLVLAMEHINQAREQNGQEAIPMANVLMVGDSATDIQAGQNAGTKTCAITGGYGNKEKLAASGADCTLTTVFELIVRLQRIATTLSSPA